MMTYTLLKNAVEDFVREKFAANSNTNLVYHTIQHTEKVVANATQIALHYQLNEQDDFIVVVAAWFHDIGYFTKPENHEPESAAIAESFLSEKDVSLDIINEIKRVILATRIPQNPHSLNEKILCDADLFHLGSEDFTTHSKRIHEECMLLNGKEVSKNQWRKKDLAFLQTHTYHTTYCKDLLDKKKQKNIKKVMAKLEEDTANKKPVSDTKNEDLPSKGVETMFRITSSNNQRLSDMADNKAQILITVNSIILSLIVSLLLRRLEDNTYLVVPTFMLLLVSLSCIVFSILATRPSIPKGVFTEEDVNNKKVNLVFFGNFYNMPLDNYKNSMKKVMADREFLYGTLITDVYAQGVVLGKKYKLIRIAYNIFMFGLIVTVFTYIISYLLFAKN